MKKLLIIHLLTFWLVQIAMAQITGQIVDATDEEPVPYASAIYRGNKNAVSSNGEGKFTIERHNGKLLNRTYRELSLGIHNIFKLLHVEYVRRLSYLDSPQPTSRA